MLTLAFRPKSELISWCCDNMVYRTMKSWLVSFLLFFLFSGTHNNRLNWQAVGSNPPPSRSKGRGHTKGLAPTHKRVWNLGPLWYQVGAISLSHHLGANPLCFMEVKNTSKSRFQAQVKQQFHTKLYYQGKTSIQGSGDSCNGTQLHCLLHFYPTICSLKPWSLNSTISCCPWCLLNTPLHLSVSS